MTARILRPLAMTAAIALLGARVAQAGPPLLCFPFEIGQARSLPVGPGGWESIDRRYDATRLVDDTLALLEPTTPVIVRMETLRRATLYAANDPQRAEALLDRLRDRARVSDSNAPLAVFDFGYLAETYKQATHLFGAPMKAAQSIDGFSMVQKAAALRDDPAITLALAVMTRGNTRLADAHRDYVARVLNAASTDRSIAANVARQLPEDLKSRD
jgi:hypothetical protein